MPTLAIIGAGPNLGLATAARFGAEGFDVGLVARNRVRLQNMQDTLAKEGIRSASGRPGGRPALPGVSTTPCSPHVTSPSSPSWSTLPLATEKSTRSTSRGDTRTSGRASRQWPRPSSP
jgi:hypothetical protein